MLDVKRNVLFGKKKKTENGKNVFFKALGNRFRLTKLFMVNLLSNGLHEKVMICHFCLESTFGNNYWSTEEKEGA